MKPLIFIAAAEPSGDFLAANIINNLKSRYRFIGVGGSQCAAAGLKSSGLDYRLLHVMGFWSLLPIIFKIHKFMNRLVRLAQAEQPQAVITVDSPDFALRIAKRLKKTLPPTTKFIHVVAPSVWAWRKGRAKQWEKIYHKLYCLLPFEPAYFKKGMAEVIAHPVLEGIPLKRVRNKPKVANPARVLVLAGSRPKEIKTHLPMMLAAVEAIGAKPFTIRALDTTAIPTDNLPNIHWKERHKAFKQADVAIAVSGTVTLETAAAGVPTLVLYGGIGRISQWILKKLIRIKYASIVNILANKPLLKELLGTACNEANILKALKPLVKNGNPKQKLIAQTLKPLQEATPLHKKLREYLAKAKPR